MENRIGATGRALARDSSPKNIPVLVHEIMEKIVADTELTQNERDVIDAIIKDAQVDLCVTEFEIMIELAESDEPDKVDGYSLGAQILVQYRSLHATITLYPCLIADFRYDPQTIIAVLYHEIAHIITNRFKDLVWPMLNLETRYEFVCIDAYEHTTEILGRLALKYRQSFDKSYRRQANEDEKGNVENDGKEA